MADDSESDADRRLIERYLAGDAASIRTVRLWIRGLLGVRYPMLHADREDLCQTVHAKLVKNLRHGAFAHTSTLKTYALKITHYTAVDLLRKRSRERTFGLLNAGAVEQVQDDLARIEEKDLLHTAVHLCPKECRTLWKMNLVDGLSFERIGRDLGIPVGTVKSKVWRCRKRLTEILRGLRELRGGDS